MKYKLLKSLPDIEVGTIIEYRNDKYFFENGSEVHAEFNDIFYRIFHRDSKDWYEEVKEPKTIYDLKEGDRYWYLCSMNSVWKQNCMSGIKDDYKTSIFLTEREAKRNKLLRELATRTDKWLPEKGENYLTYGQYGTQVALTFDSKFDYSQYHMGIVFRNELEYYKYITPEAEDLLFKL